MKQTILILATTMAGNLCAQTPPPEAMTKTRTMHWESSVAVAGAPQEATIGFLAAEAAPGFPGSAVKGAPYSATIENAFTQTLADGTRIERKSTAQTARDSEGRTRMEHTPAAMAPVPVELPSTVIIQDPVAKQTIILNDKEKTATILKMPDMTLLKGKLAAEAAHMRMSAPPGVRMRTPMPAGAAAGITVSDESVIQEKIAGAERVEVANFTTLAAPTEDVLFTSAIPAAGTTGVGQRVMMFSSRSDADKPESLGKQSVSGVSCDATRSKHTIAAGQIGNDRPIDIVTESCVSAELKTVLSSRTVDPMHGDNTMRLSSINRSEPAKSLFEVPAGYTVKEGPSPMMFERKIERSAKPAQ